MSQIVTLTGEQLFKKAKQSDAKLIVFYKENPEDNDKAKRCHVIKTKSAVETISQLKEFATDYPHQFYVILTANLAGSSKTGVHCWVDFGVEQAETIVLNQEGMSRDQIRKELLEELAVENEKKALAMEKESLAKEKADLMSIGGKVMFFATNFYAQLQQANAGARPEVMQGAGQGKEDLALEYQQAMEHLTGVFGADGIIALSKKLKEQPGMADMVKNFIK